MTSSTTWQLECKCGHTGTVKMRENDQPFSTQWESWSVSGFSGNGFEHGSYCSVSEALERIKPLCDKCGEIIQSIK